LQPVADTLKVIGDNRSSVTSLNKLLNNFEDQNGYFNLASLAIGLAGAGNGTNSFGHFIRSGLVVPGACFNYTQSRDSLCSSDWANASGDNSEPKSTSKSSSTAGAPTSLQTDTAALDYLLGGDK
jgi:hypothetical protein